MASTASGPLKIAVRASSFTQTGSWSMVELTKSLILLPIDLRKRFEASRVQPSTMLVAEAVGMSLHLSRAGRHNLYTAISQAAATQTLAKTLEIGFGIHDITRAMIATEGGIAIAGLCAALRECYSDDVAVEILREHARTRKAESSSMPSNMEWKVLLDACAGTLATSAFPHRAETLMMIAGRERSSDVGAPYTFLEHSHLHQLRACAAPQSIAAALHSLAEISCGSIEEVVISGQASIGWLAAVQCQQARPGRRLAVHSTRSTQQCI